jgi:hypothetical protein
LSGTNGLLSLSGTTDNGVITLNGTAPNATVETNLTFNGATLTLTGDQIVRAAATQDGVRLLGRAGGTGNFYVDITPTTLSANRSLTLANGNTVLVTGTMVETTRTITISGTANQVISSAGAQSLAGNRTWTLSLPQNIHTAATPTFGGLTLSGAQSITGGGLTIRTAATQDGVIIAGRAGGTGDFDVTISPTTLTADRTLTLADGNTVLVGGTMLTTARTISTTGGITGGGDLSADRTFTIADGALTNAKLANSSITVTAGTGMSGGGAVSLGGSVTLTNAGVTSNVAGTGISVSGATGAVTITNTGVTSLTGTSNQISVSAGTGAVTLSTPQNIHTAATPTFGGLTINGTTTTPRIAIQRVSNVGNGISWYNSATYTSWSDYMSPASQTSTGPTSNITAPSGTLVTSWALRRFIENAAGYGWTFESGTASQVTPTVVAEIRSSDGAARFGGGLTLSADSTSLSFSSATGAKTISTGGSTDLFLSPGGNVRIGTAGTAVAAKLQVGGDIRATGEVVAYAASDKNLKDNIQKIQSPLEIISKIGGYTFDWNKNQQTYTGKDYGVIAQEIEEVMPELVITRESGYKAVNYEKIIPLLIESIKEQQNAIVAQQTEIKELREVINNILNK